MEQSETLRTIAEVATAFAGFSGVVVVLGRRDKSEWTYEDTSSIVMLLFSSLGVVFFAFVPLLVEAAGVPVWRISNGLFGVYHLLFLIWAFNRTLQAEKILTPWWVVFVTAAVGLVTIGFNCLVAAGFFQTLSFFAYLAGLVWLLAMATTFFAALLFESRGGVS